MENNTEPLNNQKPSVPPETISGGRKVLQPLSQDLNSSSATPVIRQPNLPSPAIPNQPDPTNTPSNPISTPASTINTKPNFDVSSIYPDITKTENLGGPAPIPNDKNEEDLNAATFSEGYSIGTTIFLYQLGAAIILSIINYGILSSIRTTSATALAFEYVFFYLFEYLVFAYLPYRVLVDNQNEDPLWLTLFGIATQSVIVAIAAAISLGIVIGAILHPGASVSLTRFSANNAVGVSIVIFIAAIVISYFLTKLSWGIAFYLFGKLDILVSKTIGVAIISIIVIGIIYHFISIYRIFDNKPLIAASKSLSNSSTSSNTGSLPITLARYTVTGNPSYSVDFYKDSAVSTIAGVNVVIHSQNNGEQVYLFANTQKPNTGSCLPTSTTFTFNIQGSTGTGCFSTTEAVGHISINGQNYNIDLNSDRNDQTLKTTETIYNSISFN
jgi:hypothetical protein